MNRKKRSWRCSSAKTVTQQKKVDNLYCFCMALFKGYPNICHPAKDRKIMDSRVPTGKTWRVPFVVFPVDLPRLGEAANLWSLKKKQFWRMEPKNIKALQVLLKCDFWTSKKSWKPPSLSWKNDIWVRYIRLLGKKPFQTNVQQQNSWIFIFERMVLK